MYVLVFCDVTVPVVDMVLCTLCFKHKDFVCLLLPLCIAAFLVIPLLTSNCLQCKYCSKHRRMSLNEPKFQKYAMLKNLVNA